MTANEQDLEKRTVMVDNLKSMVGANIYERYASTHDNKHTDEAVMSDVNLRFGHETEFVKECVKSYLVDKQSKSGDGSLLFEHNYTEKTGKMIVGFDNSKITNDLIDCIKTLDQNSNMVFEHSIAEGMQNRQDTIKLLKKTIDKQKETQVSVEVQKETQVEQPTK